MRRLGQRGKDEKNDCEEMQFHVLRFYFYQSCSLYTIFLQSWAMIFPSCGGKVYGGRDSGLAMVIVTQQHGNWKSSVPFHRDYQSFRLLFQISQTEGQEEAICRGQDGASCLVLCGRNSRPCFIASCLQLPSPSNKQWGCRVGKTKVAWPIPLPNVMLCNAQSGISVKPQKWDYLL